jgi:hypothetical protein
VSSAPCEPTSGSVASSDHDRGYAAIGTRPPLVVRAQGLSPLTPVAGVSPLRLAGLLAFVLAALFAFSDAPASAAPPTQFGTEGEGAGQMQTPEGIAVEQQSGDVYVSDRHNNRVDKFGPEGEFLLGFGWGVADRTPAPETCGPDASPPTAHCFAGVAGSGAGQLSGPVGIAVDNSAGASAGDIYVVDPIDFRVQKFGPGGEFILMVGGDVDKTTGANLCTAASGDECGAGISGSGPGEFVGLEPNSVAVGPNGSLYVGDEDRIQKFGPAGVVEAQISLPGVGFPNALAVDSVGDIYINSFEFNSSGPQQGVHKYDPSGVELGSPRDPGFGQGAIALDSADRLYADGENGPVNVYGPSGDQVARFGAGTSGFAGIAYGDTIERVYVLPTTQQGNGAVRLLAPPPPGPYVLPGTEVATALQPTSATLDATVNPEGAVTEYSFQYVDQHSFETEGGFASPDMVETASMSLAPVDAIQTVTVKATSGSYLLRFKGESSAEISFEASAPEVQAALEGISAIGAGNVSVSNPEAGLYAVEFIGSLGDSEQPSLEAESTSLKETVVEGEEERTKTGSVTVATTRPGADLFTDRPVSAAIESLQPGTVYHFRIVATAGIQTTQGTDQTFVALPPVSIDSTSASEVSATGALLGVELNPHGLPTTVYFEYDTRPYAEGEAPHGTATGPIDAGSGAAATLLSTPIQGLTPSTTYYFRAVARNGLGTVEGSDRSFTTQGPIPTALPDDRGWEMVSPPNKEGIPLEPQEQYGGAIQASAEGSGLAYIAKGAIGSGADGNRSFSSSQDLATRGPSGWSSEDITTANESPQGLLAGRTSEYPLFSSDLSSGIAAPFGATPLSPLATERVPYLRQKNGSFLPLVIGCPAAPQPCPADIATNANVPPGTHFGGEEGNKPGTYSEGVEFLGGSADLHHLVLTSQVALTGEGFQPGFESLYEWTAGRLDLISLVPPSGASLCGGGGVACVPAAEQEERSFLGQQSFQVRNAVSADGNLVFFETIKPLGTNLFVRDRTSGETLRLNSPEPGLAASTSEATFQIASTDGSKVFFTDPTRLTSDSTAAADKPDLYMCEIGRGPGHLACNLSNLTVDPNPGESADVIGGFVPGAADDGSSVYFVANGALTPDAVAGDCTAQSHQPASNRCDLYRYDTVTETARLVAILSGADSPDWGVGLNRGLESLTARVSPNGRWLAFMSQSSLTGYDNRDAVSGRRDEEVFLYDSHSEAGAGGVICASCNPTGARPSGVFDPPTLPSLLIDRTLNWENEWLAGSIPGWTPFEAARSLYQPRYLSDSGRLFFNSSDALVSQDSNGVMDVYEYEPPAVGSCSRESPAFVPTSVGCVSLISSGTSSQESGFLDASESGDDVFFLTGSKLAPTDVDNALDVYDARVGGGPAQVVGPVECSGDGCQQPAVPPNDATPGSLTFNGAGNTKECAKGKKLRKGKCVKKQQKKAKKKKHKKGKSKNSNRKKSSSKSKEQKRATGHHGGGHK